MVVPRVVGGRSRTEAVAVRHEDGVARHHHVRHIPELQCRREPPARLPALPELKQQLARRGVDKVRVRERVLLSRNDL